VTTAGAGAVVVVLALVIVVLDEDDVVVTRCDGRGVVSLPHAARTTSSARTYRNSTSSRPD
jgi:hypothetical protein